MTDSFAGALSVNDVEHPNQYDTACLAPFVKAALAALLTDSIVDIKVDGEALKEFMLRARKTRALNQDAYDSEVASYVEKECLFSADGKQLSAKERKANLKTLIPKVAAFLESVLRAFALMLKSNADVKKLYFNGYSWKNPRDEYNYNKKPPSSWKTIQDKAKLEEVAGDIGNNFTNAAHSVAIWIGVSDDVEMTDPAQGDENTRGGDIKPEGVEEEHENGSQGAQAFESGPEDQVSPAVTGKDVMQETSSFGPTEPASATPLENVFGSPSGGATQSTPSANPTGNEKEQGMSFLQHLERVKRQKIKDAV